MGIIAIITLVLIAVLHYYIFVVEAFLWNKTHGLKVFGLEKNFADATKVMAINQGVYNSFLASGIVFALIINSDITALFFLACIFIAGIVGAITSSKKIIFIQSLPALISALLVIFKV